MRILLRRLAGFLAGLVVAFLAVQVAELGVHALYPPPPGTNMKDFEQVKKFVASLPAIADVLVLSGWLVGTLAGTYLATRIGGHVAEGYALTLILFSAGIMNALMIPQPKWFTAASFVIYIVIGFLGTRLGVRGRASRPARAQAFREYE